MNPNRIDPIIRALFLAVFLYTLLLLAIAKLMPNDGQTFQVISTILSGFSGALLGRIHPGKAQAAPGDKADPKDTLPNADKPEIA